MILDTKSKTYPKPDGRVYFVAAIVRYAIHGPDVKVLQPKTQFGIVFKGRGGEVIYIQYFLQFKLAYQRDFVENKSWEILLKMALDILGIGAVGIIIQQ